VGDLSQVLPLEPGTAGRPPGADRRPGAGRGRGPRGSGHRPGGTHPLARLRPGARRQAAAPRARHVALRGTAAGAAPGAAQVRRAHDGRGGGAGRRGERGGGRLGGRVRVEHTTARQADLRRDGRAPQDRAGRAADLRALRQRDAVAGAASGARARDHDPLPKERTLLEPV